ncbi:unnamed protein product [Macrosiphum euphorbiae]|uniref:Uncharacterized protein n=1 Tax=Macrosiphum euphorbiae TaxID=13131 RepID=A0AAV0X8L2_9HEMI|nr:unnamed protein product [Macrosiphum euphorbiae]
MDPPEHRYSWLVLAKDLPSTHRKEIWFFTCASLQGVNLNLRSECKTSHKVTKLQVWFFTCERPPVSNQISTSSGRLLAYRYGISSSVWIRRCTVSWLLWANDCTLHWNYSSHARVLRLHLIDHFRKFIPTR